MKIIIEVSGGVVQNVVTDGPADVSLVDHDNIKAGDSAQDCLDFSYPNYVAVDIDRLLREILSDYDLEPEGNPITLAEGFDPAVMEDAAKMYDAAGDAFAESQGGQHGSNG